jgi:hypothetical protein
MARSAAIVCVALAASVGLRSRPASAFVGEDPRPVFTNSQDGVLTSIKVTIAANGNVHYSLTGYSPTVPGLALSAECDFEPSTGRAKEELTFPKGSYSSSATCRDDPWMYDVACDLGVSTGIGMIGNIPADAFRFGLPAGARVLSVESHNRIELAYMQEKKSWTPTPTPTPFRRSVTLKAGEGAARAFPTPTPTINVAAAAVLETAKRPGPEKAPVSPPPPTVRQATPTPTPVYPPYGAVYTGGNPPATMKAGTAASVAVTVQNTSSQTWPAGGNFRLSFHWFRGGVQVVHDGDRTLLPSAVPPGATVNLMAKVTAPWTIGAATLQWDMVQEGVTWFSNKGVPMSAPKNVNVTP